ncbi:unnamed protein product [Dicrocoelium dendriticum]|nr:unnamed protein product [Dicrocoelium dendriticum]
MVSCFEILKLANPESSILTLLRSSTCVAWNIYHTSLDHRLGEKLNELVHCGTTIIKHNGRRFLLRTPICPALKLLNHITGKRFSGYHLLA